MTLITVTAGLGPDVLEEFDQIALQYWSAR
jgi:hypothetical protein